MEIVIYIFIYKKSINKRAFIHFFYKDPFVQSYNYVYAQ